MSQLKYEPIQDEYNHQVINDAVINLLEKIAPLFDDKQEPEKIIQIEEQ